MGMTPEEMGWALQARVPLDQIMDTHEHDLAEAAPNTPAEARTGTSDRIAAALADVANLRYGLRAGRVDWTPELDRIEAILRGGR